MIQRRQHLRFTPESGQPVGIARERIRQHLERDVAIELRVAGAVDLAHAAGANGSDDLVRPKTRAWTQRHGLGCLLLSMARGPARADRLSSLCSPFDRLRATLSRAEGSLAGPQALIPPSPSEPRISYGPSLVPAVKGIGIRDDTAMPAEAVPSLL